jgi:hypothetical protein
VRWITIFADRSEVARFGASERTLPLSRHKGTVRGVILALPLSEELCPCSDHKGEIAGAAGMLWLAGKWLTSLAARGFINPGWSTNPELATALEEPLLSMSGHRHYRLEY